MITYNLKKFLMNDLLDGKKKKICMWTVVSELDNPL